MPLKDLQLKKKGKLLTDKEFRLVINSIDRKSFIDPNFFMSKLKNENHLNHLFTGSESELHTLYDKTQLSKILKSIRQETTLKNLPAFKWNASKKRYEVIYRPVVYQEEIARKFILSAINQLSHRPELKVVLEDVYKQID